jgi:small conductance mechanosensitive channel
MLQTEIFTNHFFVSPIIIVLTIIIALIFKKVFKKFIEHSTEKLNNDPTNYKFLLHAISALIYIVGFSVAIYSIPYLRTAAQSMLAGAGILAVVIGFASQQALSNIVSGVFIVIFKPFRVNDRLQIRETMNGIVEDITLRHTVLRDFENKRIIIPNSVMSNEIVVNANFSDNNICKRIDIAVGYKADLKKAKEIMKDEVLKHPEFIDNRTALERENGGDVVPVRVIELNEYSVTLRAWSWTVDPASAFIMGCDLLESIKLRFDEEGIEIPYPYNNTILHKSINK